ncbi:MAG: putative peptidoglycan glycosyltransferase FtsW [Pseudomonadota bacterium]|nr:putative peptidoglycan glycosyltransferase FtsW [Pseudomonadota bacterium]
MRAIPRTDNSIFGEWWWTVDRLSLAAILLLGVVGAILVMAASPSIAVQKNLDGFHFIYRHLIILGPSVLVLIAVSLLSPVGVCRLALVVFLVSLFLMLAVLVNGVDANGARRWLSFMGWSMQPSEFIKPSFVVVTAWLIVRPKAEAEFSPTHICILLLGLIFLLLLAQPDFGMAVLVGCIWFGQYFLAGMPIIAIVISIVVGLASLVGGYHFFPHVQSRFDRYLDPSAGDRYQINHALNAFANGGLFGKGPGEGIAKERIPDAHADFIFAVAGEELGLICCLVILALFLFIVLRGVARLLETENLFALIAGAGLAMLFGLQAFINLAVTLDIIPTKGMTLPFVSYGGSSLLALGLGMGMLLALTRRHRQRSKFLYE